jgi:hypothetical protein
MGKVFFRELADRNWQSITPAYDREQRQSIRQQGPARQRDRQRQAYEQLNGAQNHHIPPKRLNKISWGLLEEL